MLPIEKLLLEVSGLFSEMLCALSLKGLKNVKCIKVNGSLSPNS